MNEPPQQKRCPSCGALSPLSTRFCPMCSHSFSGPAPQVQQQAPPQVIVTQAGGQSDSMGKAAAGGCITGMLAGGGVLAGCVVAILGGLFVLFLMIGSCMGGVPH